MSQSRPTLSPADLTWLSTTTLIAAALATALAGCEPTRAAVTMPCTGSQHCPADGKWTCDLTVGQCVRCAGACPGASAADIASNADADGAASDTAVGPTPDAGVALADAMTADTANTGTLADATGGPTFTCKDRCDAFVIDEPGCSCDDQCASIGDCCPDLATFCPALTSDASSGDASSGDASSGDASSSDGDSSDTGALPSDATQSDASTDAAKF